MVSISRRRLLQAGTAAALGIGLSGVPIGVAQGYSEKDKSRSDITPPILGQSTEQESTERKESFSSKNISIQRVRYRERGVEDVRERVALLVDITNILKEPTGFSGAIEVYSYKMLPSANLNNVPRDEPQPREISLVARITKENLIDNLTGVHGGTLETVDNDTKESKRCEPGVLFFPISHNVHTSLRSSVQGNGPDNSRNIDPTTIQEGGGVFVHVNRNYRSSGITLDENGNLAPVELEYAVSEQMFKITKLGVEEIPRELVSEEYKKLQTQYLLYQAIEQTPPITPDYG